MVKRIASILLSFLMLVALSGVTVTKHYCMGHLQVVKVVKSQDDACGNCGMKMNTDCCDDVTSYHQFDEDFSFSASLVKFSQKVLAVISLSEREQPKNNYDPRGEGYDLNKAPPEWCHIPVYKEKSSYII
jgi:hypothetical protein